MKTKIETEIVEIEDTAYEVVLHPEVGSDGFWVECPALPGCASQGDDRQEALEMIKDAIAGQLEVLAEMTNKDSSRQEEV